MKKTKKGFTLIEILVVIGIIAVLAAIVIVAINPGRQFAQARNTQRTSNVESLLNAVGQNIADNKGLFSCPVIGAIPTTAPTDITSSVSGYDLRTCLVPDYISELPVDPSQGIAFNAGTYDTNYTIQQDAVTSRITVCAPYGNEPALGPTAGAICLTR